MLQHKLSCWVCLTSPGHDRWHPTWQEAQCSKERETGVGLRKGPSSPVRLPQVTLWWKFLWTDVTTLGVLLIRVQFRSVWLCCETVFCPRVRTPVLFGALHAPPLVPQDWLNAWIWSGEPENWLCDFVHSVCPRPNATVSIVKNCFKTFCICI